MTVSNDGTGTGNMFTTPGTTGDVIPTDRGTFMAIAAFTAVAWFNVLELNIQVFMTFKRHRGLYFWSLIISSYGCILHALGFLLKFFQLSTNNYLNVTIITIGWYAMVTGQAIVLYSRLHLVVRDYKVLRAVLAMIIVDAICLHIPTTVLTYGSNLSNGRADFIAGFNVMERIQMTMFCIEEFIISGIYVYATIRLLRPVYHGRTRKVMLQLIWINLIIIGMDMVLLVFEYQGNYEIEATLKAMVYSIKLKLEFAVLNQLMSLANSSVAQATNLNLDHQPTIQSKRRSKSLTYLSKYSPGSKAAQVATPQKTKPNPSSQDNKTGFGHKWVPSLDRKAVVETQHVENTSGSLNIFTNPAAVHPTHPPGFHSSDDIDIEHLSAGFSTSPLSPTLTGSTLNHSNYNINSHRRTWEGPPSRQRPPPNLRLDLSAHPAAVGVLRSNRPSVSDWAHGPDSESSPSSSEMRLDPFEKAAPGLHQNANARLANQRTHGADLSPTAPVSEREGTGLDFVTSAL